MNTIVFGGLLLTVCVACTLTSPVAVEPLEVRPVSEEAAPEAERLVAEETAQYGGYGGHHGGGGFGHHHGGGGYGYGGGGYGHGGGGYGQGGGGYGYGR